MIVKNEVKKYIELRDLSNKWDRELEKSIENDDVLSEKAQMIEDEFDKAYDKYWEQKEVIVDIIVKYTKLEKNIARKMLNEKENYVLYLLENIQK